MQFTYAAYRSLLSLLREGGYAITDYHNYTAYPRCVILRHDIDTSISQAVRMAETEAEAGVRSTFFVLLRTDLYNPASAAAQKQLRRIQNLGHELGLHFDEAAYPAGTTADTVNRILQERNILSSLLETPVTTVSMHRPSRTALEADLKISGMINTYERTFFRDFKYLSDSRRRWREPVEEIVCSGEYDRLHILTHAFWYHEQEQDIGESIGNFIRFASAERYEQMRDNITDLPSILTRKEF